MSNSSIFTGVKEKMRSATASHHPNIFSGVARNAARKLFTDFVTNSTPEATFFGGFREKM